MVNSTKKWHILYTKGGSEKKISNLLNRKNVENYLPLKREYTNWKRLITEPLFNSYVFVNVDEEGLKNVRNTDGVINFAYWLGKPAIVKSEEIELMKRFLNEYSTVRLEKIPFDLDGSFRSVGTSLSEQKGQMISVNNNTVKIVLPSIGFFMIAELSKTNFEIANSPTQSFGILEKFQFVG